MKGGREGLYGRPWVGVIPCAWSSESVTKGVMGGRDWVGILQRAQERGRHDGLPVPQTGSP